MTRPDWRPAYIGIGSNLDDPVKQVQQGIEFIDELPRTTVVLRSSLYRSTPMGPQDQPDYINAVVAVLTEEDPDQLLSLMMEIERRQGRKRSAKKWGPRTLDLDLLAYSSEKMTSEALTLPHPGIRERIFVLLPWVEITPHFRVMDSTTVAQLGRSVHYEKTDIQKLD
jgi:2-amino-4-hydroxy-6-hydroxymethyldihydropteridine diphosphokinase